VPLRFRFRDEGTVWTENGRSVYSIHSRRRARSSSESSAGCDGCAAGDLGVLLGVLAAVDLGVPLGVFAALEARLAAVCRGVGFAFDAVAFLRIVWILDARSRRTGDELFVSCSCFDALTVRVDSLFKLQCWKVRR
jgi:hypothetical protein